MTSVSPSAVLEKYSEVFEKAERKTHRYHGPTLAAGVPGSGRRPLDSYELTGRAFCCDPDALQAHLISLILHRTHHFLILLDCNYSVVLYV